MEIDSQAVSQMVDVKLDFPYRLIHHSVGARGGWVTMK